MRLTRDHTMDRRNPAGVPLAPLMDVNAAAARDFRHLLTDTMGMSGSMGPQIDVERFRIFDGDIILLCTNGLTDVVNEEVIATVLVADRPPDEISETLVAKAVANGGIDDTTVVVARYRVPEEVTAVA
jgi:serine/threonine protein phosphatase PrpC